ncbi:MAG: glycoside hydrolase family 32 protein [Nitrososphaeria archaeon]
MKKSRLLEEALLYISKNKFKVNGKYRLKFHLMGECGWVNDPNGFIFYNGLYHCFFQYNPFEPFWGPTYWGHAVSKDLVKWDHLPIALAPNEEYDKDGCFSGSAIEIDGKIYLMYTGHVEYSMGSYRQVQCIAYSKDGVNFVKYFKNPVIDTNNLPKGASKCDFRDPKVIKKGETYYVIIASRSEEGRGQILLYKSKDFFAWEYVNTIVKNEGFVEGDIWECPDLFELEGKYILITSIQQKEGKELVKSEVLYFVGDMNFEAGIYKIEKIEKLDHGRYFYAPQTMLDDKGRRLMIAWMDNWNCSFPTQKGHNWAGAFILPREVFLINNRLIMKPVEEIKKYREKEVFIDRVMNNETINLNLTSDCIDVEIHLLLVEKAKIEISIFSGLMKNDFIKILYNSFSNKLEISIKDLVFDNEKQFIDLYPIEDRVFLRFLLDKSSIEVFANEGEKVVTNRVYPLEKYNMLSITSEGICRVMLKKWDIDI